MPHRIPDFKSDRDNLSSHHLPGTSLRTSHVPEVSSRLQQSWVPRSTASARSSPPLDNAQQMCLGDTLVRPGRPPHGSIRLFDGSVFPEAPPGFAEGHRGTSSMYNPTIEDILLLSESSSESTEDNPSPSVTPNHLHLRGHDSPTSPPVSRSQPSTPPARNTLASIFNPKATEFSPCPSSVSSPRKPHAQPVHGCDTFVQSERANKFRSVIEIEDDRDREEAMNDFIFDQATPWALEDEAREKEKRELNRRQERLGHHRKTSE
ncbi:hypothetical protein FHETE_7444 [Fusarium heterosporum]|uniref:Uncharacterized protein n=1 Tax=Fusarium heterosporum TaxID=42747 RepID=A0A8H5WMX5_FUSHE|nr:hypothetical protein FHETE_7444 [Fusarium heterosporum]